MHLAILSFLPHIDLQSHYIADCALSSTFTPEECIQYRIVKSDRADIAVHLHGPLGLESEGVEEVEDIVGDHHDVLAIVSKAGIADIADIVGVVGGNIVVLELVELDKLLEEDDQVGGVGVQRHVEGPLEEGFREQVLDRHLLGVRMGASFVELVELDCVLFQQASYCV